MLTDLMSARPRERLPARLSHARLTFCIRRLARAKSPAALPWVGELLVKRPDEVQDLANYMLALIGSEPDKVVAACQYALTNKAHMLDWGAGLDLPRVESSRRPSTSVSAREGKAGRRVRLVKLAGTGRSAAAFSASWKACAHYGGADSKECARVVSR